MDFNKYSRIVNNPRHVPSIHNYCDRWCERCPLTLRCANFATQPLFERKTPPHDRAMESLWPRLVQCKPLADALLAKHADHAGVGIAESPKFKSIRKALDENRAGAAAKRYMEFAHTFVEQHQSRFQHPALPPAETPASAEAGPPLPVSADEAFDIISWYHLFITVKLSRALHRDEFDEELEDDPDFADMPRDSDGSGKIVLLSIDRCIIAWAVLATHLPEFAEPSLNAMLTLDRLRRAVEKEIPKARAFVRPGFDTLKFPDDHAHRL